MSMTQARPAKLATMLVLTVAIFFTPPVPRELRCCGNLFSPAPRPRPETSARSTNGRDDRACRSGVAPTSSAPALDPKNLAYEWFAHPAGAPPTPGDRVAATRRSVFRIPPWADRRALSQHIDRAPGARSLVLIPRPPAYPP